MGHALGRFSRVSISSPKDKDTEANSAAQSREGSLLGYDGDLSSIAAQQISGDLSRDVSCNDLIFLSKDKEELEQDLLTSGWKRKRYEWLCSDRSESEKEKEQESVNIPSPKSIQLDLYKLTEEDIAKLEQGIPFDTPLPLSALVEYYSTEWEDHDKDSVSRFLF